MISHRTRQIAATRCRGLPEVPIYSQLPSHLPDVCTTHTAHPPTHTEHNSFQAGRQQQRLSKAQSNDRCSGKHFQLNEILKKHENSTLILLSKYRFGKKREKAVFVRTPAWPEYCIHKMLCLRRRRRGREHTARNPELLQFDDDDGVPM